MPLPAVDTALQVETPEGIALELRPAGLPARSMAYLIDFFIRFSILVGTITILASLGEFGTGVMLVIYFVLEWFYPVVFELSGWAGTPGKRAMSLRVVMDDGLPVTLAASLTRNLLRAADFLPALYGAGILAVLLRSDFKRLGDIAAATLVVHVPQRTASALPLEALILVREPEVALSAAEQSALMALAVRAPRLTDERVDELAAIAAQRAVSPSTESAERTRKVLGTGLWLLGHR